MTPQLSSPGDHSSKGDKSGTGLGDRSRDAELGIGRGRWLVRDIPVVVWIVFLLVVIAAHPGLPVARWLMIHLLVSARSATRSSCGHSTSRRRCCTLPPRRGIDAIRASASDSSTPARWPSSSA